jgi:probable HAF family extracellular repeat protein
MSGSVVFQEVNANNGDATLLFGINDSNDVVGFVIGTDGLSHSFVATDVTGSSSVQTIFDAGGSSNTDSALAINNSEEIVGTYTNAAGTTFAYSASLSDLGGAAAIPNVPANADADSIDANGDIVGVLIETGELFQVSGGVYQAVPNPPNVIFASVSEDGDIALIVTQQGQNILATTTGVGGGPIGNLSSAFIGQGVNDVGQVVGNYNNEGFFRDADGTVYGINIAGATGGTSAEGINDNGEIVGYFVDSTGTPHGFTTTVDDVIAADDVLVAACYCAGTLIATEHSEMTVEDLKIGDRLVTRSGALRPIKWIGRRSYGGRFIAGNKDILPVCIKAGALADNVPRRDLWISPHHAMFIDGLLIEARHLVTGTSIVQAERADKISYFHIELETHDVIVAEGALSETYLDEDNRGMFQNAHEYETLFSSVPALAAQYCAPRADDGYELEAVRRRIARRAASSAPAELRVRVFRRA